MAAGVAHKVLPRAFQAVLWRSRWAKFLGVYCTVMRVDTLIDHCFVPSTNIRATSQCLCVCVLAHTVAFMRCCNVSSNRSVATVVVSNTEQGCCDCAGTGVAVGRQLCEAHIKKCLAAGVKLSGLCAMALPGQWSYTIGPVRGIELADQLWISRYILLRVSEEYGFKVSFDPKPIPGDWSGTGCHIHFSTWETRAPGSGLGAIQLQMQRLQLSHLQHMMACGQGNMRRLLDSPSKRGTNFSCEVGNKRASIMIPRSSLAKGCGHYVDRRAGSNMDPYLVTMFLVAAATGVGLPVLPPQCSSDAPSQSWCKNGTQTSESNNSGLQPWERSEEILIDALEKLDQSPDTPPNYCSLPLSQRIIMDDECSDGTSPERDGPLSYAARGDMYFD